MMEVIHRERAFSDMFVAYLLTRNIRYEEDLVDQLFNSSEKRLARILLLLAHFGKDGKPEVTIPKISQETLAEMVGTTRSRVNFFMNRFRKLGFVRYNGGLKSTVHFSASYSTTSFSTRNPQTLRTAPASAILQVQPNQLSDLCSLDQTHRSVEAYAVSIGERRTVVAKGTASLFDIFEGNIE